MSQHLKFITTLLSGESDRNIKFAVLRNLLLKIGFAERIRGSHHIFTREGIEEIINLQSDFGGKAKPYQVKQVRELLVRHNLIGSGPPKFQFGPIPDPNLPSF